MPSRASCTRASVAKDDRGVTQCCRKDTKHFGQSHCFRGFPGACCRRDISHSIHAAFRQTTHYRLQLKAEERRGFEEFMRDVFFAEPARQNLKGVPFKFGDALEPKFLRNIGFERLEAAVGAALDVKFPPAKATRKAPVAVSAPPR